MNIFVIVTKNFFRQDNVYVIFVRKYAKYLDEKVSVFRLLNMQFEKHHDAFKTASVDALIKQVPKLQSQFNALLNCRVSGFAHNYSILYRLH